jgi:hypothetical protein
MAPDPTPPTNDDLAALLSGMEHWTAAVHELYAHAVDAAGGPSVRGALLGARDDALDLHDLLRTANRRADPNFDAHATIASICRLWDANQVRFEQLAKEADPAFHEAWAARTGAARAERTGRRATSHDLPQPA